MAYPSLCRVELLLSAAERCLAPSSPMLLSPILQARAKNKRQGVLTVGKWCAAAYSSQVRALFAFRASEMCFAPSSPMPFDRILPTGVKCKRQGVLTLGERVCGGVLELGEGLVRLKTL